MRVIAKNTAVTAKEDIISAGGTLTFPTEGRLHALVSSSLQDCYKRHQITTATIVGTIDVAGAGDIEVIVTSALVTGSPLTLAVAVANNDTASQVATKVRAALNAETAITDVFTVGGSNADVSLTTKNMVDNDATLNIAYDNGTATGLTPDATSAATQAGGTGTGANVIIVKGINENYQEVSEAVQLDGVTAVNTTNKYLYINSMEAATVGTNLSNVGTITATAATDSTVTSTIGIGLNQSLQGIFMLPSDNDGTLKFVNCSAYNATAGAVTTIDMYVKRVGRPWVVLNSFDLYADAPVFIDKQSGLFETIPAQSIVKFVATPSAGSSSVNLCFDIV